MVNWISSIGQKKHLTLIQYFDILTVRIGYFHQIIERPLLRTLVTLKLEMADGQRESGHHMVFARRHFRGDNLDMHVSEISRFRKLSKSTLILIMLILFRCAHEIDRAKRLGEDEMAVFRVPNEEQYWDAGAVVILDEGKMQIIGSNELPQTQFERHRIVKIYNQRGWHHANVTIPYTPQSWVENIQARTILPTGTVRNLDKKQIFDVNLYPRFVFYSDQRAKIFTLPSVESGAIIEYRYQLRISGHRVWPSWYFQDDIPVLKSRFTLETPSEWELNYKKYFINIEPTIAKAPAGFKSSYVWQVENIPAIQTEFGMPAVNECLARIEIAPVGMKSWNDVARWYYDLAEPQIKSAKGVKQLADSLTQHCDNDLARLKMIYEWVRDHVRYIAVAIGIGSYQPHPAGEVLANRYGDCKDMSILICALSRAAGIEAHPVLISTWQNGEPDTSLPSPYQFNHAIVYCPKVGEKGIWLDATQKGCPFASLPWYDQGLPVLVIGKDGAGKIATTTKNPADSNRTVLDWRMKLRPNGQGLVQGSTEYRGVLATDIREMLSRLTQHEVRQWLETYLAARCPGAKLDSFRIVGLHPIQDPLVIYYHVRARNFAQRQDKMIYFSPGKILGFDLADYFRSPKRQHPILFNYGSTEMLSLDLEIPSQWTANSAAISDSIISPFGYSLWQVSQQDSVLQIKIVHQLNGETISADHYLEFQKFLDEVQSKSSQPLIFRRIAP